jgi:hypothetical protein
LRRHIAFGVALIVLNIAGYMFIYYVPAAQYSPAAGHRHEVGYSIFATLMIDVVVGVYCAFRIAKSS